MRYVEGKEYGKHLIPPFLKKKRKKSHSNENRMNRHISRETALSSRHHLKAI